MKSLSVAWLLLGAVGFANAQNIQVQGESKLNTDFSKYKTFGWAEQDKTPQSDDGFDVYTYEEFIEMPGAEKSKLKNKPASMSNKKDKKRSKSDVYVYSYNVIIPSSNEAINTVITSSIEDALEGRGYVNAARPDLLVTYRVLEKKGRFKGYKDDSPTKISSGEVRQPSDTITYTLEPGTLMIGLIDTKTSQLAWEGFASGLMTDNAFTSDEVKIRQAINLIFEKFRYRADKYGSNE
jgi:hypothetical protein